MIAFMFIFNILFCSVFHPFRFVKFAVGREPRGWSAGGMGGSSARAMRSEYKGPRWRECWGPGWRECRGPGGWSSIGVQLVRVPGALGAAVQEVQVVLECFMGLVINGLSDQRVWHKWSEWLE